MMKILIAAGVCSVFLICACFSLIQISRLSNRVAALEAATSTLDASARNQAARIQAKLVEFEGHITAMQVQATSRPLIDTSTRVIRDLPTPTSRF